MRSARLLWIWSAALTPFAAAVLVHTVRPPLPCAIAAPDRPALVFEQYLVDLGRVLPTTEVRGTFAFRNRGESPVRITDVHPSCGCLLPRLSTKELAPGETGYIVLRMQPANESPGRKTYTADVRYEDPRPHEVRLTFRVEVPERQLMVRPRGLLFYQLGEKPTTQWLTVSDARDNPATVTGVSVNKDWIAVALLETRQGESGARETEVKVTVPAEVPPGRHEAWVTVETDDPDSPVLRVPLMIQGRAAAEAETATTPP